MKPRFFDLKNHSRESGYKTHIHVGNEILDLHTHDYYEVFLTETDKITHMINGTEVMLPAGSLVFVRPWDVHRLCHSSDFNYIIFNFSREIFERLMNYLQNESLRKNLLEPLNGPVAQLTEPERERLYEKFCRIEQLQDAGENQGDSGGLYMRRTLLDIFITYFTDENEDRNKEIPDWFQHMLRQMEKHANFIQGVSRMEEISGMSRRHISRSMQKYMGIKPIEYLNELRLQYAASLLVHSNLNILEIAMESGFQSESYFYHLFSSQMGMSPKRYRKLNKE